MNRGNPEYTLTPEDIAHLRTLAEQEIAVLQEYDDAIELSQCIKVIEMIERIPEQDRSAQDRRNLAKYQDKASEGIGDDKALVYSHAALKNMKSVIDLSKGENDFSLEDWQLLNSYYMSLAALYDEKSDKQNAMIYYKKALNCLEYIVSKNNNYWEEFAWNQKNIGMLSLTWCEYTEAENCFLSALDLYINNSAFDESQITEVYSLLMCSVSEKTLDYDLYVLARDIFHHDNDSRHPSYITIFMQLHSSLLKMSLTGTTHRAMLQLMTLVENNFDSLSNLQVKEYLSVPANLEDFKRKRKQIEIPQTLLNTVAQASSFPIGMALAIKVNEEKIKTLEQKVEILEKENKKLRSQLKTDSIYDEGHTIFSSSSSTSSEMNAQVKVEQKHLG